jgi:hypothetical protein
MDLPEKFHPMHEIAKGLAFHEHKAFVRRQTFMVNFHHESLSEV